MGEYDKAIEYYKKALDVWPGFAEARINLGVIFFHMGDFIMARRFFLRVDHDHGDVRVPVYLHLIENGTS
jgi:tetratricopeptide (TPR) repeat protein